MTSTPTLAEQIDEIKRKALDMFHADHNDGDTALYYVFSELPKLLIRERLEATLAVMKIHRESADDADFQANMTLHITTLEQQLNEESES